MARVNFPLTEAILTSSAPASTRRSRRSSSAPITSWPSRSPRRAALHRRARRGATELNRRVLRLEDQVRDGGQREFVAGPSPALRDVLDTAQKVARTAATVLILGESGTGKELLARRVHRDSEHADGPFIAVNMAAIPRDLVESHLFGHEKGSFTGAVQQRIGKFELASGGTLFLDEIGDLPLDLQAKLLRAIQEQEIERVGGDARSPRRSASSRPPTSTSSRRSSRAPSGPTSSTGSTSSR